jgi:hypothetical protein
MLTYAQVCATGFGKSYPFFTPALEKQLEIDDDGMYLYRHMLSPKVLLDMCPHTTICVSSRYYLGPHATYYLCPHATCVSMEIHMCQHRAVEIHDV